MRLRRGRISDTDLAALSRHPNVVAKVEAVANAIQRDAARLAPKRTGNLRRSIATERDDTLNGGLRFVVGWTQQGYYGRYVEFGTERARAQPHLIPAAIKHGAVAPKTGGA